MAENWNLCMGCMEYKGEEKECSHCDFVEGTVSQFPYHLHPGTVLNDRYILGRVLGNGGFGITYIAWDIALEIKLAVKEFFPRSLVMRLKGTTIVQTNSEKARENFELGLAKFIDEARILARFNSYPGIVSVQGFFEKNSTAYIVMNYVEGVTLKQYLEKRKMLTFYDASSIMASLINTLAEIHEAGLLHRDISPDNIFISSNGQVTLLDFGAARYMANEDDFSRTVILKQGYSPPEQYFRRGRQGPWTDVYALAATIYRMISGVTPPDSLTRRSNDSIKLPSEYGAKLFKKSESALMKALALDSEERFLSIREFQKALTLTYFSKGESLFSWRLLNLFLNIRQGLLGLALFLKAKSLRFKMMTGAVFLVCFFFSYFFCMQIYYIETPEVRNISLQEAEDRLTKEHLKIVVKKEFSNSVSKSNVIDQNPKPGKKLRENGNVTVIVSEGITVPNFVGMNIDKVLRTTQNTNISVTIKEVYNNSVVKGAVIEQQPVVGAIIDLHDTVTVFTSIGQDRVITFPDKNLMEVVRAEINMPDGDIMLSDVLPIKVLRSNEESVSNLEGIGDLKNLNELYLLKNQISDIRPLMELTSLTSLNLESNSITDISPLKGLTKLKVLSLGLNQITDVSVLADLTILEELRIDSNKLENIDVLKSLFRLKKLCIGGNTVKDINVVGNLSNLEELHLGDLQISDLSILKNLKLLKILYLWNNNISDISVLDNLKRLEQLYLNNNKVSDITGLKNLTNLKTLVLKDNVITDISALSNLNNIEVLALGNNKITSISPLRNLGQMKRLMLYDNQISDIAPLANLKKLEGLNLNNNKLSDISSLKGLINLKELYLSKNPIRDFSPLDELKELKVEK